LSCSKGHRITLQRPYLSPLILSRRSGMEGVLDVVDGSQEGKCGLKYVM
jgi:hypothetical protein